jgi:hypothetical protein
VSSQSPIISFILRQTQRVRWHFVKDQMIHTLSFSYWNE